jgi:hypothetical protein
MTKVAAGRSPQPLRGFLQSFSGQMKQPDTKWEILS